MIGNSRRVYTLLKLHGSVRASTLKAWIGPMRRTKKERSPWL
ncbi:hypothetical protein AB205_0121400 [Aquarana catesbeiana]|uniref:Uncharacterized protein n=1 Tax=Aquarana catesbeiana TaxID=8400 RepID=A0A2G9P660_AQUCT|nr:hypothetical protein AB205_0121400 [Aquarana catesbeiana]